MTNATTSTRASNKPYYWNLHLLKSIYLDDYRDQSALHQRMLTERNVHPDEWTVVDQLNDLLDEDQGARHHGDGYTLPIWAYKPYGTLRETPFLPTQPGFRASRIQDIDKAAMLLELFPRIPPVNDYFTHLLNLIFS